MEPQEEAYITVKEAALRIGYSTRQTDRFIRQRKLEAIQYNRSLRKVSVASIDAFNAQQGRRPVDPLEGLKANLHIQEQVAGDILRQLAALRQQVAEQHTVIQRRVADLEGQGRTLLSQLQHEQETRRTLEQLVAALVSGSGDDLAHLFRGLARLPARASSPQEKRGFPPGTIRLAHFAQYHSVEPSTLRRQAEQFPDLATIHHRPRASVNKREWWLLPAQQPQVIAHWRAQGFSFTPCPDCPHDGSVAEEQEQSEAEEVKTT